MHKPTENEIASFRSKVDTSGGPDACHPWTGATTRPKDGYGVFGVEHILAHRFAYILAHPDEDVPLKRGRSTKVPSVIHTCPGGDNSLCCNDAHLRLGPHRRNMQDRDERGRTACGDRSGARTHPEKRPRGENTVAAKLSESKVIDIRIRYAGGETIAQLAAESSVSWRAIWSVVRGKNWKHVAGPIAMGDKRRRGLTDQQVTDIRTRVLAGETLESIAAECGLSSTSLSKAVHNPSRGDPSTIPGALHHRKISDQQVTDIRVRALAGESLRSLADEYGLSAASLSKAVHNPSRGADGTVLGKFHFGRVSIEGHEEIIAMRVAGHTLMAIAEKFGVSKQTVCNHLRRA